MRIAIDIDNTLVDYRKSISKSLKNRSFKIDFNETIFDIDTNTIKYKIKDELGDHIWQFIQGDIYSDISKDVLFYKNSLETIKRFMKNDYEIYLISHKTKYGIREAKDTNILEIAQSRIFNWITKYNLQKGIKSIIFCDTYDEKISFLKTIKPKIIIDDLEVIHNEISHSRKDFTSIYNILFCGRNKDIDNCENFKKRGNLIEVANWKTIANLLNI